MSNNTFEINFGDTVKKIVVTKPKSHEETEADIYSSQVFARLAKQKNDDGEPAYMVRAKLDEFLRDIGIYTIEDFERLSTISTEIGELEDKIYAGQMSKAKGREIAINLRELRYEMLLLLNKKLAYDVHTIEHHCQNARMDFLITKCIKFDNGEQVFKSVKDYKEDDVVKPLVKECIQHLATLISNYDDNYERKLPENKFLLKFGYCNEELSLVDPETGMKVNSNGELINDDGDLVDKDGNLIDLDGDLIEKELGDFFDEDAESEDKKVDLGPPKKKVTKKAAKKASPKKKNIESK